MRYHRFMPAPIPIAENPAAREALSRVEVLYTDLDGTLLARGGSVLADGQGEPSTCVVDAIVELNRRRMTVVPVSGRTRPQLAEATRLLGWTDFIGELGGLIAHGPDVTYNIGDWDESLLAGGKTPFQLIEESGAFDTLAEKFPGRVEYHAPWHHNRQVSHLLRGCLDNAAAQAALDALELPVAVLDNGIVHPREHALTCEGPIHSYHLVPAGVSKAQAISLDLKARGLDRSQAAAIGDSLTDLDMSSAVGFMALVRNAFDSASVVAALDSGEYPNVCGVCCERGEGWAEFARAWIAARGL
jgi:HAD superfamily hydrolase (TIGR01484 family)